MKKTLLATLIGAFLVGCVAPQEEEAFHPTDALLIGGNGGFNPSADDGGADLGEY